MDIYEAWQRLGSIVQHWWGKVIGGVTVIYLGVAVWRGIQFAGDVEFIASNTDKIGIIADALGHPLTAVAIVLVGLTIFTVLFFRQPTPSLTPTTSLGIAELKRIERHDRSDLGGVVRITQRRTNFNNLHLDQPYIDFSFHVFNGAVVPVMIDQHPEGNVIYQNTPFKDRLQVMSPPLRQRCEHGAGFDLVLRQWIAKELAQKINQFVNKEGAKS